LIGKVAGGGGRLPARSCSTRVDVPPSIGGCPPKCDLA
jgi:hypothetical protein